MLSSVTITKVNDSCYLATGYINSRPVTKFYQDYPDSNKVNGDLYRLYEGRH